MCLADPNYLVDVTFPLLCCQCVVYILQFTAAPTAKHCCSCDTFVENTSEVTL
jgi:hypothetical protein